MTRFYIIAGVVVLVLIFGPVALLSLRGEDYPAGQSVLDAPYLAKIKSFDPATCGDTSSAGMQGNIYESLYAYHYLKRPIEVIPQLAAEMPDISDDNLTYTVRLRPDINYARNACFGIDEAGRPRTRSVRAEDFVLAFKRIADFHIQTQLTWSLISNRIVGLDEYRDKTEQYAKGDFARYDLDVEGIRALDELTLQITLKEPFPPMIYLMANNNYAPIPREVVDYYFATEPDGGGGRRPIPVGDRSITITRPEEAVGTGAYMLEKWERGSRIVFTRNPEYHHGFYPTEGEPSDVAAGLLEDAGKPLPFIDVLDYTFVGEDLPLWLGFLAMQTDVTGIPQDVFAGVISPDRGLREKWKERGIRLVTFEEPAVFWYAFNMEDPLFKNSPSLRKAMCLAFNVEQYIEVLLNGRGRRAVNVLPSSFKEHEIAGPGPYYRYDPDAAAAMLEAARAELDAAGLLDADGRIPEITLDLGGMDEAYRRIGEFAQQQFEPLGVRIDVRLNDWPTLQQKVHNKQAQLYTMGWHADYPDAENFLQLFYSPNIEKGTNNSNYSNPEFDALYEKIRTMTDSPERRAMAAEMVDMISEDVPVLLLAEPVYFVLVHEWVENYKRHPIGYGMMKYVRIDTELKRQATGH